jgi:hypothetical protein
MSCSNAHWIDEATTTRKELHCGVSEPAPQAVSESLVEVSNRPQLLLDPALVDFRLQGAQRPGRTIAGTKRLVDSFNGEHSALNSNMNSLQSLRVQQACRIANDQPTIDMNTRHRIPTAFGQRLRPVPYQLTTVQNPSNEWVSL